MSKVAIKGNPLGTGTFTIESPNSDVDSTILLPVGGGSVVLTDATQTLTNKSISAAQVNSGTLDAARIPDLAASKITSGTIATARLASGTANSTTFLRGDSTWQTISTTPTTAQVLTATAGASAAAVGTYTTVTALGSGTVSVGDTTAGSNIRGIDAASSFYSPGFSGTWRNMGASISGTGNRPATYLRIS